MITIKNFYCNDFVKNEMLIKTGSVFAIALQYDGLINSFQYVTACETFI